MSLCANCYRPIRLGLETNRLGTYVVSGCRCRAKKKSRLSKRYKDILDAKDTLVQAICDVEMFEEVFSAPIQQEE